MPILYTLRQDTRAEGKHNFYGRVVHPNRVDTDQLAERIQRNCTVKKSDVVAVLTELVEVMRDELQNSNVVKLNGFGTFRVSMESQGVPDAKDFTTDNIKRLKVNFLPQGHLDAGSKKFTRTFLEGATVKKYSNE